MKLPAILTSLLLGLGFAVTLAAAPAAAQTAQPQFYMLGELNPAAPLYKSLPPAVAKEGAIVTGIIIGSPPSQFIDTDSRELKGFNIDLLKALSKQLGVPFKAIPTDFAAFIPGLQAKRFAMVAAFVADSAARQKVVDFVDYYATKDLALANGKTNFMLKSLDELCGHSVALDQGHYLVPQIQAQQAKCKAENRPELRLDMFRDDASLRQAVRTGRSEMLITSSVNALYSAKMSNGELRIGSEALGKPVLVGYTFLKGEDALLEVVRQAFANIMKSGEYVKVLDAYGIAEGALKEPFVNQGPNAAAVLKP